MSHAIVTEQGNIITSGRALVTCCLFVFAEDIEPVFEVLIPEPDMVVSSGQEARLGCQARTDIEVQQWDWTRINAELPTSKS